MLWKLNRSKFEVLNCTVFIVALPARCNQLVFVITSSFAFPQGALVLALFGLPCGQVVASEFGGRHFLAALGEFFLDPEVERLVEGFAVVEFDVVARRRDGGEVAGVTLGV